MYSFDHNTNKSLAEIFERSRWFISFADSYRQKKRIEGQPEHFSILADHWRILCIEKYLLKETSTEINHNLAQSISHMALAFELGYQADPIEVRDYLLSALVIPDFNIAHFFSSLPEQAIASSTEVLDQVHWLQTKIISFLLKKQPDFAVKMLETYYDLCFESSDMDSLGDRKYESEYYYMILESILQKNSDRFNHILCKYTELRIPHLLKYQKINLLSSIELCCLGLCRLAIINEMMVNIEHPCLSRL